MGREAVAIILVGRDRSHSGTIQGLRLLIRFGVELKPGSGLVRKGVFSALERFMVRIGGSGVYQRPRCIGKKPAIAGALRLIH